MGSESHFMFIVLFWAKNIVSITIHKPLSPMNLLLLLIRITGKNDRQTSEPNEFGFCLITF